MAPSITTHYLCCVSNDLEEILPAYFVLYFVQFIYTCIVWGTWLNSHLINSIFQAVLLIFSVLAMLIMCRYNANKEDVSRKKCLPMAYLLMVTYSFLPCLAGVFMFFGNPSEEVGSIFVFLFSLVFSLFWLQGYCLVSNHVREVLLEPNGNRND